MNIKRTIIYSSLIKPFYRQNAAALCFFVFIMTLDGVGLVEYHYALIKGIMTNHSFLLVVMIAWLVYAIKCANFFLITIRKQAFFYLYLLSLANARKIYWLLLQAQFILFLPVFSYVTIMVWVGYNEHWYMQSNLVLLFNLLVCAISAWWYLYLLQNPNIIKTKWELPSILRQRNYVNFLLRYILNNCKVLVFVVKFYSCITLYLMLDNRIPSLHQDLRMEVLFFSIGMLGHGIIIHRLKEMENTTMLFYRGLPISLSRRFLQYGWFYVCLFVPEIIIIASRTPAFLNYSEACYLILLGYGILLLLNSLQLYNYTGLKGYLKTVAQILFAVIIAMIVRQLYALPVLFLLLSVIIFFRQFYRFDPRHINSLVC